MILGSSSMLSLLIGLVTTKYWAVLLGTEGVGYLGLLQNLLQLLILLATFGLTAGLVRFGAQAVTQTDWVRMNALRRASWRLAGIFGAGLFLVLVLFGKVVAVAMIGKSEPAITVILLGAALIFSLGFNIHLNLLNAFQRIHALAKANLLNRVIAAIISIICIGLWGLRGILPSMIIGAGLGWLIVWIIYLREVRLEPLPVTPQQAKSARDDLLKFVGSSTPSALVGFGVQLLMSALVLQLLDQRSVGLHRPVMQISTIYLGFILTVLAQDYFPRLSAISHDPAALLRTVNEQHQLILLLAVPMIVALLAFGPWLIPLMLTRDWTPSLAILQWQLIGDLLKFSGWTLAYVLLARNNTSAYFLGELTGGLSLIACLCLFANSYGLQGLGLAYAVSYAIYYGVVWILVRREVPMAFTPLNWGLLLSGVAATLALQLFTLAPLSRFKTPLSLVLASLVCGICLWLLDKKYHALRGILHKLFKGA